MQSIEFTRQGLEEKLEALFRDRFLCNPELKHYPSPIEKETRCKGEMKNMLKLPLTDVNLVFLAGGTCRIPFVQKWIKGRFPNAEIIIEKELEVITVTGAALHALQVLNGEVKPYIKVIKNQHNVPVINIELSDDEVDESTNNSTYVHSNEEITKPVQHLNDVSDLNIEQSQKKPTELNPDFTDTFHPEKIITPNQLQHCEGKPLACSILYSFYNIKTGFYNMETKEESDFVRSKSKSLCRTLDELIEEHKKDIAIIIAAPDPHSHSNNAVSFKKSEFKHYGKLVHFAKKEEFDFNYYLSKRVNYSYGEHIIWFGKKWITLHKYISVIKGVVIWKEMKRKENKFGKHIDFNNCGTVFHLQMNKVHAVFDDTPENITIEYGSELQKHCFKSINFISDEITKPVINALLLARYLLHDPEVSFLVKINHSQKGSF